MVKHRGSGVNPPRFPRGVCLLAPCAPGQCLCLPEPQFQSGGTVLVL